MSSSCESHIFFTFHNSTYVFCPSDDDDSGVSFDAQFKQNDDRLFRVHAEKPESHPPEVEQLNSPVSGFNVPVLKG